MLVLRSEVQRISERTGLKPDDFAEDSGKQIYEYILKKREDGSCIFLRNNICSIYDLRPLVCRFFPFYLKQVGSQDYLFSFTKECPGLGRGKPLTGKFFRHLFTYALKELNHGS
ncbi:YkgJ family cysteine cluster protein [Candidatus Bathyarchaeota archaeon]|nr:YkgJ family cysteine cluster protein [Candidatus Bathyarchaeota archaeon]